MTETARSPRERYRVQQEAGDALLAWVACTGDPRIPWREVVELGAAFTDEAEVLGHLAGRWSRNLAGRLDPIFDLPDSQRDHAANSIATEIATERPALHAVLRHHHGHPVVTAAREKDRARAGLAAALVHAEDRAPKPSGTGSLVRRERGARDGLPHRSGPCRRRGTRAERSVDAVARASGGVSGRGRR